MRHKTSIPLVLVLILCFGNFLPPANAQDDLPQLMLVEELFVHPSGVELYEAEIKKTMEYDLPYSWSTFVTDDYRYYFCFQLNNFAGIDSLYTQFADVMQKIGLDKIQAMHERLSEIIKYEKFWVIRPRPDLSYVPEMPQVPEENPYCMWHFYYLKISKEGTFEDIFREWIVFNQELKNPNAYMIYQGDLGTEVPLYIGLSMSKSAAAWHVNSESFWEAAGAEGKEKLRRMDKCLRKYKSKAGVFRPDLSYTAREK